MQIITAVQTVGKTYMACAGLKSCEQNKSFIFNETKRGVDLAFDMMEYVKNLRWGREGHTLKIKIGIHYGPVIAGVIGYHKPQFSLIGDTVNTTSRVCSTGLSEKIIISEQAWERVKNYPELKFEVRQVFAKGKGQINTYITTKSVKRNSQSQSLSSNLQQQQQMMIQQQQNEAKIEKENQNQGQQLYQKKQGLSQDNNAGKNQEEFYNQKLTHHLKEIPDLAQQEEEEKEEKLSKKELQQQGLLPGEDKSINDRDNQNTQKQFESTITKDEGNGRQQLSLQLQKSLAINTNQGSVQNPQIQLNQIHQIDEVNEDQSPSPIQKRNEQLTHIRTMVRKITTTVQKMAEFQDYSQSKLIQRGEHRKSLLINPVLEVFQRQMHNAAIQTKSQNIIQEINSNIHSANNVSQPHFNNINNSMQLNNNLNSQTKIDNMLAQKIAQGQVLFNIESSNKKKKMEEDCIIEKQFEKEAHKSNEKKAQSEQKSSEDDDDNDDNDEQENIDDEGNLNNNNNGQNINNNNTNKNSNKNKNQRNKNNNNNIANSDDQELQEDEKEDCGSSNSNNNRKIVYNISEDESALVQQVNMTQSIKKPGGFGTNVTQNEFSEPQQSNENFLRKKTEQYYNQLSKQPSEPQPNIFLQTDYTNANDLLNPQNGKKDQDDNEDSPLDSNKQQQVQPEQDATDKQTIENFNISAQNSNQAILHRLGQKDEIVASMDPTQQQQRDSSKQIQRLSSNQFPNPFQAPPVLLHQGSNKSNNLNGSDYFLHEQQEPVIDELQLMQIPELNRLITMQQQHSNNNKENNINNNNSNNNMPNLANNNNNIPHNSNCSIKYDERNNDIQSLKKKLIQPNSKTQLNAENCRQLQEETFQNTGVELRVKVLSFMALHLLNTALLLIRVQGQPGLDDQVQQQQSQYEQQYLQQQSSFSDLQKTIVLGISVTRFIVAAALLFKGLYLRYINEFQVYQKIAFVLYSVVLGIDLVQLFFEPQSLTVNNLIEICLLLLLSTEVFLVTQKRLFSLIALAVIVFAIALGMDSQRHNIDQHIIQQETSETIVLHIVMFLYFLLLLILQTGYMFRNSVVNYNFKIEEELKVVQQSSLVMNLLPSHILTKFLTNPTAQLELTDQYQKATLLFADIAGFTKYSSSVQPEQVVTMLRRLFTEFDKMCLQHQVYKVYTIGDCYVVLGVVDIYNRNPSQEAYNVVQFAFSLIDIIRDVREQINFSELDMRIGVHTGNFIGGITGTDIVRYDIYGQDVMIANKMESNGNEGAVLISEVTKEELEINYPNSFIFEKAKDVKINEELTVQTFFIYPADEGNLSEEDKF